MTLIICKHQCLGFVCRSSSANLSPRAVGTSSVTNMLPSDCLRVIAHVSCNATPASSLSIE